MREHAPALGIQLSLAETRPSDYEAAFASLARERPDALFVSNSPVNFGRRQAVAERVARARLPAIYHAEEFVQAGGSMSYGTNVPELFRRAAAIAARLLNGAPAATRPVEQPTVFDLVVNLRTAAALGIRMPPSVVLRASRVLE